MRKVAVFAVLFVLAGCASRYRAPDPTYQPYAQPRATEAEITAAMTQHSVCQLQATRELDDKKSDAATVARAVDDACASARQTFLEVKTRGSGYYERLEVEEAWPRVSRSAALKMVLRTRAKDQ